MQISKEILEKIITKKIVVNDLSTKDLELFCIYANKEYRSGNPIISDSDYDFIFLKELRKRVPNHKFFQTIEVEGKGFSEEKHTLPQPMLSTDKAYSFKEIIKWTERILKSADELSFNNTSLRFLATPKLDGFAGYDDGIKLYTRGDGKKGSDITRVFDRGLKIFNNSERGQGAGEIVV